MIALFEEAVIIEDIASGVQRYQLVIQEAKLRLDFAIAPSIWLIPSNLIINTESVIGYNNFLQKVSSDMIFGQNELINESIHSVGLDHNLGIIKTVLPTLKKITKLKKFNDQHSRNKVDDYKIKENPKLNDKADLIINENIKSKFLKNDVNHVDYREEEQSSHENQIAAISIVMAAIGFYFFSLNIFRHRC